MFWGLKFVKNGICLLNNALQKTNCAGIYQLFTIEPLLLTNCLPFFLVAENSSV